jgi:hypothetical protein
LTLLAWLLLGWSPLGSGPALAVTQALAPQVRAHAGLAYTHGPSPLGIAGGAEARLTRLLSVDAGGFVSPVPMDDAGFPELADPREYFHLRHAVFFAPGLRVPHAQPKAFAWEVFARLGLGVGWVATLEPGVPVLDKSEPYRTNAAMAGFAGADAYVRFGHVGVRLAGRAWTFSGDTNEDPATYLVFAGQGTLEALYEF